MGKINTAEEKIKKEVGDKVYNSACEYLEKHEDQPMVTCCDDEVGAYVDYKKDVADVYKKRRKCSAPKKYFGFGKCKC